MEKIQMSQKWIVIAGISIVLLAGKIHGSDPQASDLGHRGTPQVKQQLVGAGKWGSERSGTDTQDWHVQLKRLDDDSLAGRITIVGSPLIQQARIEGQISGSDVYGVLVGDDDIQVATFTGSLFKGGISGTYTTNDGDSGNWSWDGPMPEDKSALSDQPSASAEITALGLEAPGLGPSALRDQPAAFAEPSALSNQPSAPTVDAVTTDAKLAPQSR